MQNVLLNISKCSRVPEWHHAELVSKTIIMKKKLCRLCFKIKHNIVICAPD